MLRFHTKRAYKRTHLSIQIFGGVSAFLRRAFLGSHRLRDRRSVCRRVNDSAPLDGQLLQHTTRRFSGRTARSNRRVTGVAALRMGAEHRIVESFQPASAEFDQSGIPRIRSFCPLDQQRHPAPLRVLDGTLPCSAAIRRTANDDCVVGQAIDVLVARHGVANVETRLRIERRDKREIPGHQVPAVLGRCRGPKKVLRQDAYRGPFGMERAEHRRLIHACGTAGHNQLAAFGGMATHTLGELDVGIARVSGAEHRNAACVQEFPIAAAEQDRRCRPLKVLLQTLG